ncbi:MAG TPA: hypothetical protein VFT29_00530 [Gemmatimonadaceae bacterium]|nr:hypothetical protein [Gemmatimonadaceae bacterium]
MTSGAAAPPVGGSGKPAPALRTLLRGVVDYAGLFPPAAHDMATAVAEYADYRNGPDAWALGRFVLPAARLAEFHERSQARLPREGARSWALSALVAGSDIEEDLERIERFNASHSDAREGAVLVDTVELKTHSVREIENAAERLDRRFDTFMEIPAAEDPVHLVDAISRTKAKAKIRTGGVTPDAFPSSAQIVRFIERCLDRNVAFKATAGLHHPWRAEHRLTYAADAPSGTMFGFLNMLLCVAVLCARRGEAEAIALLEERNPGAVRFDDQGSHWRPTVARAATGDVNLPMTALELARESMASFGSCSFSEPLADLRSIGLL